MGGGVTGARAGSASALTPGCLPSLLKAPAKNRRNQITWNTLQGNTITPPATFPPPFSLESGSHPPPPPPPAPTHRTAGDVGLSSSFCLLSSLQLSLFHNQSFTINQSSKWKLIYRNVTDIFLSSSQTLCRSEIVQVVSALLSKYNDWE